MNMKTQTSRRGMAISAALAFAIVAGGVGVTAAMQSDDKPGSTAVEQGSQPQPSDQFSGQSSGQASNGAPATPTFLAAADLPATSEAGTWHEHDASAGLPDPEYTCIKGALPAEGTSYKSYSGDMTAEAREVVTMAKDASAAELLAKEVAQSIERCADAMQAQGEDSTTWKNYGSYPDVADGLAVYGVYFAPENSEYHLQLFGVGRDGANVVVLSLGQGGKESEAPVEAFTASAKTAVEKAF